MMDARQIQRVRESFALVEPQVVQVGALFYDTLFERDPQVGLRFHGGMDTQSRRLFEMIGDAVRLLNHPEQLGGVLAMQGLRHLRHGVRDEHYDVVGAALLDTLAASLAPGFTPEVRRAWADFYAEISRLMRDGARRQVLVLALLAA